MVTDAFSIFGYIVSLAWELLSFEVPGLDINGKNWVLALVCMNLTCFVLSYCFGLGGSGIGYRSGSGRRGNIPKERQGDER